MCWKNCSTMKDYYMSCSEVGLTKEEKTMTVKEMQKWKKVILK